ncbi:MAG: NAD(P)/FAD-dependent oxidoreductase [Mogibacterium sp.]|nr:NAD(P)/FAD-dependent oxidoreductase [Mogibacterium sp.]MBR2541175.1 NAD(P)/FAD-dependent oxidoreductase [Mogibacterium sp.]
MNNRNYDVVIIGAGVVGCSIARELSRYELSVLVVDKESDVCEGTSKANSAIIHAGFDAEPGSLKALLNVRGNQMMDQVAEDLDVPFKRIGAMVLGFSEEDIPVLEGLMERGVRNGVPDIRLLTREEALELEPGLADGVYAAIHVPSSGIVCPFELTLAYAENAYHNGAEFSLSTEVTGISTESDQYKFRIETTNGVFRAKCVVNCAGVYTDKIHNMVCEPSFSIVARKGEYMLMDKSAGKTVTHTIFQIPTRMGKGVLVTPTVHGNLLVGPTAYDIEDKENIGTTSDGIGTVRAKSALSIKDIPYNKVITSFSGLRSTGNTGDFIIQEDDKVGGFIDVAGIESPGLSSAPAIGPYVGDIVCRILEPSENPYFDPTRLGIPRVAEMPVSERRRLVGQRPDYGQIVCRCEEISEGEILDAIRRPLGATTLDGVKRRVRAGMGRCQGGFCQPKVMDMLAHELGISYAEVKKNG